MGEKKIQAKQTNDVIVREIESAVVEHNTFKKADINTYNRFQKTIVEGFKKASDSYIEIGCALWGIHNKELYAIENYKSIADFALAKYDLKKSATHNYINVIKEFGKFDDSASKALGLCDQYKDFSCSQLVNMLPLSPEQRQQCVPDMSVREIIALRKETLTDETTGSDIQEKVDSLLSENETSETKTIQDCDSVLAVNDGVLRLMETYDFEDLIRQKEVLLNAFHDLREDKNFCNKNIRFVLELVYD